MVASDAKQVQSSEGQSIHPEWALEHPDLLLQESDSTPVWEVYTHGGRNPTGIHVQRWAQKMEAYGAGEILLTSMDRDGTKAGYDIELNRTVSESITIPLIASGGAGTLEHLYEGIVRKSLCGAGRFHFSL